MRVQSPKCKRPRDSIWANKCYCIHCEEYNERYRIEHNTRHKETRPDNGQRNWIQESASYVQGAARSYVEGGTMEGGDE